ncbi:related to PUF3-transcript-specific regulator of mRNA degradation [Sporisorium reilianum SRZ2]|uniref:Pumilio homology domain family member 3 n=1 Tax=Sporisorium reilianum (strain SRZ2) TaxID=999809 RepID=E6ZL15_SPORE|nr:related to PUF3-transcript-specific regulator of mRNA degradation [Sporisorium reilianum SRZ2]
MADRRASSFVQHRPTSIGSTSTTPSRPVTRRSASGSVNLSLLSSFTPSSESPPPPSFASAVSGPAPIPSDSSSPLNTRAAFTPQRSITTGQSPAAAMSKLDQTAWSDTSAAAAAAATTNSGSPSSVWNGRPPSTMDGDAVTTASTSNVSTPSRAPTALDAKEAASNPPIFHPSPLLPQEGSAWSLPRSGSLTWANDLAARPSGTDSAASSPTAVKRATANDSSAASIDPSSTIKDAAAAQPGTISDTLPSVSPSTTKKAAAPVPKRAPIRSATLDPSHLASKTRRSGDDDDDDDALPSGQTVASTQDDQLIDDIGSLTIATDDIASSGTVPQQHGYSSPPAFIGAGGHHGPRPSASFPPPPFSPAEAFMHPSPYGSGARSPDAYSHGYPGVPNMLPGMPPIDMSGYESYRTTPDPYAPTMPGRAIFASPGSQGSTPQSPSFGPAPLGPHFNPSMRNGEALFYPGVVPGFGPPAMAGGMAAMASPVRPGMPLGPGQYGFGPGPAVDARSSQLAQSPLIAPGMAMPVGALMMPPTSPPMDASHMPPGGPDSRSSPSLSQSSPYAPGPHRRMGSSGPEPFGPGMTMSPRPPFGAPFVPGQAAMHGMMGGAPGPMMAWNGRFHDHRRVPTGPGGVMPPVGGYAMGMGGAPMDPHYARNGAGFYGGAPFHPAGGNGMGGGPAGNGATPNHSRSPLLEEFRSRHAKNRKFELVDIYGSVVEFSSDQHGSRFIQEKLDTATDEEKKTLFDEVLPHARQLMTDVFGNYVIQKMLEHGDDEQRDILAREMVGHVLPLSLGTYGCRVVQKAFDHISAPQREKLATELDGHIMQCVRDQNANHVVQKVIERVDADRIAFIPQAFVGHVPALASHCYSCRVLQRTFEHCTEAQTRPLLDELHAEAVALMQHQYGNYVMQWVLQRGKERDRAQVIAKIKGSVLVLSRHKFASNVIEEVVRTSSVADRDVLLDEILTPKPVPAPSTVAATSTETASSTDTRATTTTTATKIAPAVLMMKDQFANYVLQRFLERANAQQRARLIELVAPTLASARRPGGSPTAASAAGQPTKHLIAIERLIDSLQDASAKDV